MNGVLFPAHKFLEACVPRLAAERTHLHSDASIYEIWHAELRSLALSARRLEPSAAALLPRRSNCQ